MPLPPAELHMLVSRAFSKPTDPDAEPVDMIADLMTDVLIASGADKTTFNQNVDDIAAAMRRAYTEKTKS